MLERRNNVWSVVFAEFYFGEFTHLIFRFFQQLKQSGDRLAIDPGRLHEGAALVCNSVDPAMDMIAVGITEMVLHVADDWVLPVGYINRAIGTNVDGGWTEV